MALTMGDVVHVAGGWLCDQVLAGWDVTVVAADYADDGDHRALRILGVRGFTVDEAVTWPLKAACLQAIAVQAELYEADERVREMLHRAVETGRTDMRVWGSARPAGFEERADPVTHRLSAAARAFKAQALAAASAAGRPAETEEFRRAEIGKPALV
jgi:hypothetical protein